jgi:hypothetical protein
MDGRARGETRAKHFRGPRIPSQQLVPDLYQLITCTSASEGSWEVGKGENGLGYPKLIRGPFECTEPEPRQV